MMIGPSAAARRRAVLDAFRVASSTTCTPPSARSRVASRAIERCGSASMMVARRPWSCQWTARQLATVLLPLPPFMVATVMIEFVTVRFPLSTKQRIYHLRCYRLGEALATGATRRSCLFALNSRLIHASAHKGGGMGPGQDRAATDRSYVADCKRSSGHQNPVEFRPSTRSAGQEIALRSHVMLDWKALLDEPVAHPR